MPLDEAASGFLHRRPVEIAEAPAECDQVLIGELLPAKQDHQMVEPGAVDGGKVPVVDAFEIDILYFSSEGLAARNNPRKPGFGRNGCLGLKGGSHPMDHVIVKVYLSGPLILAPSLKF